MKRIAAVLAIALSLGATASAAEEKQSVEEGFSLLEEGARIIMRSMLDEMEPAIEEMRRGMGEALDAWGPALADILAKAGDLSAYEAPEILPNGDIIIRKKREPYGPQLPGPNGEIDL